MCAAGQNIDAYGRDLPGLAADASGRRAWTFSDLLRHVHDAPGIERIRFATSHPRYFTGEPAGPVEGSPSSACPTGACRPGQAAPALHSW